MRVLKSSLRILSMAAVLACGSPASACPNCKEAVANQQGSDAEGMRNGYFWSIIIMISVPFSLVGAGTFMVVRAVKRGALPEL